MMGIPAVRSLYGNLALTEHFQRLRSQMGRFRAGGPEDDRPEDDGRGGTATGGPARTMVLKVPATVSPFLKRFPPGHFYSPIPDLAQTHLNSVDPYQYFLEGLDLNDELQIEMFNALAPLARGMELPRQPDPSWRYRKDNPNFPVGDALMLGAFLRHLRPKRFMEIGSGWSTALALDVSERFLGTSLEVISIEPYPELLQQTIRANDQIQIVRSRVQDVPLAAFRCLGENDVLLVDCSHVVKFGSDALHIVTRILPSLSRGVVLCIHDMWWPFEYPRPWLEEGRAWSELYLVHAFLLYNSDFEILFFNDFFGKPHHDVVERSLPEMLEEAGASLWLRRRPTRSRSLPEPNC
jgi:hypothetical protein